jgi:flagellar hook-associated protein 3 FlgL
MDQYLDNNISEVSAWLEVTDTALNNMKSILTDIRTQCANGSNDTLKEDDRNTILKQLQQLADQVYTEGNADYAGRTVFTGYRTNSQLTFNEDEKKTTYAIKQDFTYKDISEKRYYYGSADVPTDAQTAVTEDNDLDSIGTNTYNRIRLAYDDIKSLDSFSYNDGNGTTELTAISSDDAKNLTEDELKGKLVMYDTENDWYESTGTKTVGENDVIFIKQTGELILGDAVAASLKKSEADISVNYTKTGFAEGEARPEYYYDCVKSAPDQDPVTYTKEDQQINYVIASGTTITANTQASDVLDTSIGRDVDDMIDIVQKAIDAHDKVDQIKQMMELDQYADDDSQAVLQGYLDAAEKEAAYADDDMQKTYAQYLTNFDNYLEKVNVAHTNVGSLQNRLSLTKTRVENQKSTVEELKTDNDNRDISDIIIDYYAAYNAYTSSLTAAAKVGQQTLLNYL